MEQLDTTSYREKSFKVSEHIVCEKYDDCLILLHLKKNKFFKLNGTGTEIFELAQKGKTFEKISEVLKKKYSRCNINNVYKYLKKLEIEEFLFLNE